MTTKTGDFTVTQNPLTSPWANGTASGCRAAGAGAYATAAVHHVSMWDTADYTCTADQSFEITMGSLSTYDFPGGVLRWAATGGGVGYRIYYDNNAGTLEVHRWSAGASAAVIASFAQSFANGDVLKAQIIGTTIKVYKNGVQIGTDYTDANIASGQFGITYTFAGTAGTRITAFTGVDGLSAGPAITSVSSATPREGASLTITGTTFGASQGAGTVKINGVTQTVTSWSATSIVVTVVLGTNKFGAAYTVVVRDNGGTDSNAYAGITGLLPASSLLAYQDIGTPVSPATEGIQTTPALESGMQVEYDSNGGDTAVATDGSFTTLTNFYARAWKSGEGWGARSLQSFDAGQSAQRSSRFGRFGLFGKMFRRF